MILDLATVALVCFAALAWGANTPWAIAVFSAGSLLVMAARLILDALRGQLRLAWNWALLPVCVLLALGVLQLMSPQVALDAPATLLPHTIELHTTGLYLLLMSGYIALGFSIVHGFRSHRQLSRLVIFMIAFGVFESLYGLVQSLGGFHYIGSIPNSDNWAHGTLMNHNHYALLLNLAMSVGVGYLYKRSMEMLHGRQLGVRQILGMPDSPQLASIIVWLALMGIGVFLSASRMGILAMFTCLGVMLAAVRRAEGGRRATVLLVSVVFAIVCLALYVGVDAVLARYAGLVRPGYLEIDRLSTWRDAWPMIYATPWFGKGLGSFMWTFPAYESLEPDTPAMYAHNDYLQALAEVGIAGLLLMIWIFVACWRSAGRNLRSRDPAVRGIGLATLGALAAVAVQEITDYSLYIPGVSAFFILLIGLNERASIFVSPRE